MMESGIGRRDIPSRQPGVRRQPGNGHIQNQYEDMRQRNQCLRQKLQVSRTHTVTHRPHTPHAQHSLHTHTLTHKHTHLLHLLCVKLYSKCCRHNKTLCGAQ